MSQTHPTSGPPPHAVVLQMLTGKWVSAAIAAVAKFGIADHLESGPKSAKELASLTGTDEQALYRLLRATASLGVFTELEDGRFDQTPLSEPLRSHANPCLRNMAMLFLDDWFTRTWAQLPWSVQTGRSAAYKVYGKSPWEVFQDQPDQAVNFNNAMTDMSQADSPALAGAYDFSQFEDVVDIGGGLGLLLASVLQSAPKLRGTLFEMPYVAEQAQASPILKPFADRCQIQAGNFLEFVSPGADAYMMKHIIHDWDDEHSTRILSNCRKAIKPGGKLLVMDQVVGPRNQPGLAKIMDLEMLVNPGGLERTEKQWNDLFAASGFRLERIIRTPVPQCIIEGSPV
ncbi:MAG: methyltransferase [Acidobacteria bacterium]|nr:MAG: methyltransferase [Acidobacteriota bacterium]